MAASLFAEGEGAAAPEGAESRVRRRGEKGHYIYYKTTKRVSGPMKIVEQEKRLTQEEYRELLSEADPGMGTLEKTRYCLTYDGQSFDVDLYPFWQDQAILQIKLSKREEEIRFPKEIEVLREVTGRNEYRNKTLAKGLVNKKKDENMP